MQTLGKQRLQFNGRFLRLLSRLSYESVVPQLPDCDHIPKPYTGLPYKEAMDARDAHIPDSVIKMHKTALMLVEGHMQYVYDDTGKRYLDAFGGIATISVGHCHEEILAAMEKQQRLLGHVTTMFVHPECGLYAKELSSLLPSPLDYVFLVNSGTEATELATLLARRYTGNYDMISLRNGYHGGSHTAMGLTGLSSWKHPIPLGFGIHHVSVPGAYRGIFGSDIKNYINELEAVVELEACGRIAGFISEPIQGVGGFVPILDGYLKKAYATVRQLGGVCISDEVQTGFGRTGASFWGFENHDVIPDIVTMAKGIGNGVPLAAVVTRKDIADSLLGRTTFTTFGGTPPIMAAARAVLRIIRKERLQQNAKIVGEILLSGLSKLKAKYDVIGDVRGMGLMVGIEFVKNRSTKQAATDETKQIIEQLREVGLLVGKGGQALNVIRLMPPMCLTKADGHFIVEAVDYVLSRMKF